MAPKNEFGNLPTQLIEQSWAARPVGVPSRCVATKDATDAVKGPEILPRLQSCTPARQGSNRHRVLWRCGGVRVGWQRRSRAAKKERRKQMRTIDFVVPDVHGRVGIQGHSTRSRSVRADANATHIWASFASRRTCRSLCAAPLGLGGNAYFGRTVRNGGSQAVQKKQKKT
jgi:hypothetical protein